MHGYPETQRPFTFARYTGQESQTQRESIANTPPDILLTNFMMLELILTRYEDTDRRVVEHCHELEFLVLDEMHTYRGRQGADVAMLVRRLRQRLEARNLICIDMSDLSEPRRAKPLTLDEASQRLTPEHRFHLHLQDGLTLRWLTPTHHPYLVWHRERVFR